jgi:hypothetical protein
MEAFSMGRPRLVNQIKQQEKLLIMKYRTLSEFASQAEVTLDKNQSRVIGAILTQLSKEKGTMPERINRKYKDGSGRNQYTSVNTYPEEMFSNFMLGCRALEVFKPS